jgi:hypothetical protein
MAENDFELPDGWALHDEFVQSDLEKLEAEMDKEDTPDSSSIATRARLNAKWVRAAIRAGWFQSCPTKAQDVGKQDGSEIAAAAIAVAALYYDSSSPSEKKS